MKHAKLIVSEKMTLKGSKGNTVADDFDPAYPLKMLF